MQIRCHLFKMETWMQSGKETPCLQCSGKQLCLGVTYFMRHIGYSP